MKSGWVPSAVWRNVAGSAAIAMVSVLAALPLRAEPTGGADFAFLPGPPAAAPAGLARPTPKYRFLFGAPAKWQQAFHWRYNHNGSPPGLAANKAGVLQQINATLGQWTAGCGIVAVYDGETATPPDRRQIDPVSGERPDGENVVGWGSLAAGTAGLTLAWYSTQPDGSRAFIDADITLSPTFVTSISQIQRTTAHEWGHALGLAHSESADALMAGPPANPYSALLDPAADDVRGCRCLYGPAATQPAGYSCSLPQVLDFGSLPVGSPATRTTAFTNDGNAPLAVDAVASTSIEFAVAGCASGTQLAPGASCALTITARLAGIDARSAQIEITATDGRYRLPVAAAGFNAAVPGPPVEVVEFYRAAADHYFISSLAADIAALDSGNLRGWTRTGRSFKAYAEAQLGTTPVCRYYLPPVYGDSHFYGRDAQECAATAAANPGFVLEAADVMHLVAPAAGICPAATVPVYRVFSARVDANHRYTTDRALRDQMVVNGWLAEGDGPDLVAMCAPR